MVRCVVISLLVGMTNILCSFLFLLHIVMIADNAVPVLEQMLVNGVICIMYVTVWLF